jgi:Ca2+/Na+ antiporter
MGPTYAPSHPRAARSALPARSHAALAPTRGHASPAATAGSAFILYAILPLVALNLIAYVRVRESSRRRHIAELSMAVIALLLVIVPGPFEWWKAVAILGIAGLAYAAYNAASRDEKIAFSKHAELSSDTKQTKDTTERIEAALPGNLLFRSLRLVEGLSALVDQFLEREGPLIWELKTWNDFRDNQTALSQLGIDREVTMSAMQGLENTVMAAYRDGDYEATLVTIVGEFANRSIHDEFMDAFVKLGAREPYTVRNFRDGLNRLNSQYASQFAR